MHLRASAKNKLRRDMAWDIENKLCFRKGCFRLETHCELFYRCLFLYCGLWVKCIYLFIYFLQYHKWPLEHLYVWQFWKEGIFEKVMWRGYFSIVTAFFPTLMHFGQRRTFGANTSSGHLDKKSLCCVLSAVFYYGTTSPLGGHNIKIHTHTRVSQVVSHLLDTGDFLALVTLARWNWYISLPV